MSAISVLALLVSVYAAVTGLRRLRRGLREAISLELVRGIRRLVTAVVAAVIAIGLLSGERGLLAFAAVFLAEEIYETGVLALILRRSPGDCA
jgi:hypothetical protein